jgi:hypothetical protein
METTAAFTRWNRTEKLRRICDGEAPQSPDRQCSTWYISLSRICDAWAQEAHPHAKTTLEVFKLANDGSVVWKGTADSPEIAEKFVKILASISPGDYMIFSPATGEKTIVKLKECA